MSKFMYRGARPAVSRDKSVTVTFGQIVDEDHIAITEGWSGFFPVNRGKEEAPESVEEATVVEADEGEGYSLDDLETL